MALNPTGTISIGGPVTGQSINLELNLSATANSNLNQATFRTLAGIPSGTISLSNFYGKSNSTVRGIFAFGQNSSAQINTKSLVSNVGVLSAEQTGVGTARNAPAGAGYGGDKGIIVCGNIGGPVTGISNLISNTGVVASDTAAVALARSDLSGCTYGQDKAAVAFGQVGPSTNVSTYNLISNTGVVATNSSLPSSSARQGAAACGYGGDKGIFAFGGQRTPDVPVSGPTNTQYFVSNTGVFTSSPVSAGTARSRLGALTYGGDKGIFAYGVLNPGTTVNVSNLVSNTGVIASDTAVAGTGRFWASGAPYGGDKGVFGFGQSPTPSFPITVYAIYNEVSNTGVISADIAVSGGAGSSSRGACGYSYT